MNSRRTFLAGLGAAALAPHALSAVAPASVPYVPPADGVYVVGAVSNPLLPGAAGDLVLKTWLVVEADGIGFGVLADRYGSAASSHLAVQSTVRNGNHRQWAGVVTRSNDPSLVGQPFVLSADVAGGAASLELVLVGHTFSGRAVITE